MINEAPNAYIGKWHYSNETQFLENLARQPIQWAKYHSMLFDRHDDEKKAELIKTIHRSNTKKIIVCNRNMSKAQQLLRADHIVYVDFQNWFDTSFDRVLNEVKSHMKQDENHIVITCAGMGSKVLIAELTKAFPKGIYLDYGSALDLICTGRSTREYSDHYSIDYIKNMLSDIIPPDW
jgi:arylsulfatase A-like enzyme